MPWSFLKWRTDQRRQLVPVLLPESLATDVDALLEQDQFVKAVRVVRERTGLGLQVAVFAVEHRRGQA